MGRDRSMKATRGIKLGLSDRIALTVIAVGVLGLILVYYTSIYYRNIAYEHYQYTLQILATIKSEEIIDTLKADAADLARTLAQQIDVQADTPANQQRALARLLDDRFQQYSATTDHIELAGLYMIDEHFELIAAADAGTGSGIAAPLVCPRLNEHIRSRSDAGRLQSVAGICKGVERPVFVLISPFGGLEPAGYIQVVADLASSLQQLEAALGMPIQIRLRNGEVSYHSEEWPGAVESGNHLPVFHDLEAYDGEQAVNVVLLADMTPFNQRVLSHRNWVMTLATLTIALTVALVLYTLQRSTIDPLSRIHRVLDRIARASDEPDGHHRMLFAQLLEDIIALQKSGEQRFAVMILDLENFAAVNQRFGHDAGTALLQQLGDRLASVLRSGDSVSWTGTDTPGHKLLPAGTRTEYRATLARLGGDEFGMLLPAVAGELQAVAVAERIIDRIEDEYTVENQKIALRCRIGISLYPDHGQNEQELIRNADKAMLNARQNDGKYCIYSAETL